MRPVISQKILCLQKEIQMDELFFNIIIVLIKKILLRTR